MTYLRPSTPDQTRQPVSFEVHQTTANDFIGHFLASLLVVLQKTYPVNRPLYLNANVFVRTLWQKPAQSVAAQHLFWKLPTVLPEEGAVTDHVQHLLSQTLATEPVPMTALTDVLPGLYLTLTDDTLTEDCPESIRVVVEGATARLQMPDTATEADQSLLEYSLHVYTHLSADASLHPNDLPLAEASDIEAWASQHTWVPSHAYDYSRDIYTLFAEQWKQHTHDVAVVTVNASGKALSVTYDEVYKLALKTAARLTALPETQSGERIGVYLKRGHRSVASVLGVFQAGMVYVPLESSLPETTLAQIVQDAGIRVVLTESDLAHQPFLAAVTLLEVDVLETFGDAPDYTPTPRRVDELSMIFYTSGSTGVPKGVLHTQWHLVNRFQWLWASYPFVPKDVLCQRTTLNFMPSMWEMLGGLLRGIPTVCVPDEIVKDPVRLVNTLKKHHVTCINIVPSLLKMMLEGAKDVPGKLSKVRWWITCGEPLTPALWEWLRTAWPQAVILNDHGATEVNGILYYDQTHASDAASVPFSRPIDQVEVYILDTQKRKVPPYVPGEIYVGGGCLSLGYLDTDLTGQKFVAHPFSADASQRLFKLGDWGYFNQQGEIRSLGRMDNVVKVRGNRVDLNGVEQILCTLPQIEEALVLASKDSLDNARITAFVRVPNATVTGADLREEARLLMPDYMLPQQIRVLEQFPRLVNGKIDREAFRKLLDTPSSTLPSPVSTPMPTQPDTQAFLQFCREKAAQLIHVSTEEINFEKKFYEIGFDSSTLVALVKAINDTYQTHLLISDIYDYPTFRQFLEYALQGKTETQATVAVSKTETDAPAETDFFSSLPPAPADLPPTAARPQKSASLSVLPVQTPADSPSVVALLSQLAAEVLEVPVQEIAADKKYYALGFTSMSLVTFLAKINACLGLECTITIVYDHSCIAELAQYIASQPGLHMPVQTNSPGISAPAATPATDFFANLPAEPVSAAAALPATTPSTPDPIAIIGLSCKFPGADDQDAYWELLSAGESGITLVPAHRWNYQEVFDTDHRAEGKTNSKWGGFVRNIDHFDCSFFNISPMEATLMDPQQRLCLEESWRALENAGYDEARLHQQKVGVFIGMRPGDYPDVLRAHDVAPSAYTLMGSDLAILSARLAYYLNLKGPAVTVDTACSSSLVAIHLAAQSIRSGDCEMALAGGIHLMASPSLHITSAKMGMLSPEGQCKTFSNDADGFVPGEGVGILLLKPLSKALQDGDQVYGVVLGSGLNQDGKTNGITAPSGKAQTEVQTDVYHRFGINPRTISYVEAHGTGTKLGDPIEIQSLTQSFRSWTTERGFCRIGSVKTNIGHGVAAAGVAGLTKILLSFKHSQLPPSLNFTATNENIDFSQTPFVLNTHLTPWPKEGGQEVRAAINSFGFSGTNAHLVVESFSVPHHQKATLPVYLFPLSAKTEGALRQKLVNLATWLPRQAAHLHPGDLSYTLCRAHSSYAYRVCLVAATVQELEHTLRQYLQHITSWTETRVAASVSASESLLGLSCQLSASRFRTHLEKMAQHLSEGGSYDWSALFQGTQYHVTTVPAYPFESTPFWPAPPAKTLSEQSVQGMEKQQSRIRQISATTYRVHFSGQETFLTQHQYQHTQLLPGVAYWYLVRELYQTYFQTEAVQLRNSTWSSPFQYPADETMVIELARQSDTTTLVSFYKGSVGAGNLLGQLLADTAEPLVTDNVLDLEKIRFKCNKPVFREDIYQCFDKMNIGYGHSFRPIQEAYTGSETALVKLESTATDAFTSIYLLDGALQSTLALQADSTQEVPNLPFSVGSVVFRQPLTSPCWVYVQSASVPQSGLYRSHLTLCDEEGTVLVQLTDFCQRPAISSRTQVPQAVAGDLLTLQPVWKAEACTQKTPFAYTTLLVFDTNRELFDSLQQTLRAQSPACRVYWMADHSSGAVTPAEGLAVSLKTPSLPDSLSAVWSYLAQAQADLSQVGMVWNWHGLYGTTAQPEAVQTLAALTTSAWKAGVRKMQIVNLQRLDTHQTDPAFEACTGFAQTLSKELTGYSLRNVLLPVTAPLSVAAVVTDELHTSTPTPLVRYTSLVSREIRVWEEVSLIPASTSPLQEGQVFIITGGMGGVGMVFARTLGRRYKARLVLTGRSPLQAAIQQKLESLHAEGIEAVYYAADISRKEEVEQLLAWTRTRYQHIHGIIHAAGQLRDGLLLNKTPQDWQAVLAPKIQGLRWLDELTRHDALQVLLVCSSISAVAGNRGQADYAYANAYLDAFVQHRNQLQAQGMRQGRAYAVNWPLWQEGGMQLSEKQTQRLERDFGMYAMPGTVAMELVESLLKTAATAVVVAYGNKSLLAAKGILGLTFEVPVADTTVSAPVVASPSASETHLKTELQHILIQELAQLLQQDKQRLHTHKPLSEYGLDSILLSDLVQQLYDRLRISLSPALFFEYQTIQAVAAHLAETYATELAFLIPATPAEAPPAARPLVSLPVSVTVPETVPAQPRPGGSEPVAIVGISGVFPGAEHVQELYEKLAAQECMLTEVPTDRWDWKAWYGDPFTENDKTNVRFGGFVNGLDAFDAAFFGISPKEAEQMDPQQRLFLEHTWKAIEDAGYALETFRERTTGVFVGAFTHEYEEMMQRQQVPVSFLMSTGNTNAILANRTSFFFDLKGPSEVVDTACASSLVALHRAMSAIRNGECEQAVVGGVNALVSPFGFVAPAQANLLTSEAEIYSFDQRAKGYLRGEGAGVAVIKPLEQALRDGDHIYAVITGSAVSHGGKGYSLTAPHAEGQVAVMRQALTNAQLDATQVNYIEAHGTGTSIGDALELQAYKKVFAQAPSCAISTLKPNIGHLEAASGMASLFKVLLSLQNRVILPVRNFDTLPAEVSLNQTGLHIQQQSTEWPSLRDAAGQELPRRASLHSFGFGGVNAHLIVEEAMQQPVSQAKGWLPECIFVFSGRDESVVWNLLRRYVAYFRQHPDLDLLRVAYTLQTGRTAMPIRLAVAATSLSELIDTLEQCLEQEGTTGIARAASNIGKALAEGMDSLLHDRELLAMVVQRAIQKQDSQPLLQLWASGASLPWDALYTAAPHRISLPTYPFHKKRYWILEQAACGETARQPAAEPSETPAEASIVRTETATETTTTRDVIAEKCATVLGILPEALSEDASLTDLGMNSILRIKLKYELDEYGVAVPMQAIGRVNTLKQLRAAVAKYAARQTALTA